MVQVKVGGVTREALVYAPATAGKTATPVVSMAFVADVLSGLDHGSFRLPARAVWDWIEHNRPHRVRLPS